MSISTSAGRNHKNATQSKIDIFSSKRQGAFDFIKHMVMQQKYITLDEYDGAILVLPTRQFQSYLDRGCNNRQAIKEEFEPWLILLILK